LEVDVDATLGREIAESIRGVVSGEDPIAAKIMDRAYPIDEEFVDKVVTKGVMSWLDRKPTKDEKYSVSDLDLLSFLVPVYQRGAVIEIPEYTSRRQVIKKEGVRRIAGAPRFGKLTGLISNKDVFSFSIQMFDNTIITTDTADQEHVGDHRRFMVVDVDGYWHEGWKAIQFKANAEENEFLRTWGLIDGEGKVVFKYWVHPNRWQSIFGAPHLLKKLLFTRLDDEAVFYRDERKRLEAKGFRLPETFLKDWGKTKSAGETKPIQVQTIESVLEHGGFSGNYTTLPDTQEGLVYAYERNKLITYTWKPLIQFGIRANEAAYLWHGKGQVAPWMGGRQWQPYQESSRHAKWQRLGLSEHFALLLREKTVTERVSAE